MTRRVLPLAFVAGIVCAISPAAAQTATSQLSGDALAIACGPRGSYEAPAAAVTVGGSLANAEGVFAPWHRLVVNAGSEQGLKAGQEYFVRRVAPPRESAKEGEKVVYAIMTAGWVRLDQVQSQKSIASVIHECDGITPGDYLEPFSVPAVPTALPPGTADYSETGHVLFGSERATVGGAGSLMVIDRGSNQGMRPGQRVTIYRASRPGPNVIIALGTALLVEANTATIRVQDMRDAVMAGDGVAPHK